MKNQFLILMIIAALLSSCKNADSGKEQESTDKSKSEKLTKIDAKEIPDNVIKLISQDWMLITSGTEESFNTMTASWGALGEMWGKNVSFIAVRGSRYTYEFLENNDHYSLSFFTEDYRDVLQLCGSKSGRDTDKVKESGLTPLKLESGTMAFEEARLIIECKKLYSEPYKEEAFADKDLFKKIYVDGEPSIHTLYIGEIINVWIKK
jgi:flavin reductase (DIM6/NTAB) family NADH-FMN oxidoreductase RutF